MTSKVFRDPIHGDIGLPGELVALADTPEFQRLRGIKMLGTACLVYPGAVHTRFEHSLGTCFLTQTLLEGLRPEMTEKERLAVLASALLHDVTHIPYGHTLEDERRVFNRHDSPNRLRDFLPKGQLGEKLRSLGILEDVQAILTERAEPAWRYEVFSGTVCADLLDYLARDAYYCGLPQRYDRRVFQMFRLARDGELFLDAYKNGLVRHDVLSEVVNLLRLRYFLSERVYFHHTKTASGAMISRAVEQALEQGLDLPQLETLGDETLLYCLKRDFRHPVVELLVDHLRGHQVYKQAYVITRQVGETRRRELVDRFHLSATQRRAAEDELIRGLRFKKGELILYCPAFGMQLKEADVRIKVDAGKPRPLGSLALPELQILKERHQDLWKMYVFIAPHRMDKAPKVSQACESYFGEHNHLPALHTGQMYLQF